MKNNWQIKKLGDLCEIITKGTTPTSVGFEFLDNGINFIKIESISLEGRLLIGKFAHISKDCHDYLSRSRLKEGDILFSIAGALGRTAVVSSDLIPANTNQALAIIRLKSSSNFCRDFILLVLRSRFILDQIKNAKGGVAQQNLSLTQLNNFEIPVPPIEEQHRIVKILDEVFENTKKAKENTEKNLQNARELFESYLQNIFSNPGDGWEEKKLGDLSELITKGTTPTSIGHKFIETGINFVKIESVAPNGQFIPNKFAAITKECHETLKRSQLKSGDILFSIAGALGRTAYVDNSILPANTNQALAIVRLKSADNIFPKFILLALNSSLTIDKISKLKGGVAQQNLSLEQLRNFQILVPSLSEQKSIVEKLDALSLQTKKLEEIYKLKLADLEELKKSVLKKAFDGEL